MIMSSLRLIFTMPDADEDGSDVKEDGRAGRCSPYMVKSNVASGGSYNYAAACGIPSVLIERGQMGGWSPEEVHSTRKMRNILCAGCLRWHEKLQ